MARTTFSTEPRLIPANTVIQVAKLSGFSPIITTASSHHTSYLKSLGATHIIDRHIPLSSLPAEVANITKDPIEIVYDSISTDDTQQAGYDLLAPGGQIVVTLNPSVKKTDGKEIIHVFGSVTVPVNADLGASLYGKLTGLLEKGAIKVRSPILLNVSLDADNVS